MAWNLDPIIKNTNTYCNYIIQMENEELITELTDEEKEEIISNLERVKKIITTIKKE